MEITGYGAQSSLFTQQDSTLTDEQRDALQEILAGYDPESISESELADLKGELLEAGIPRNAEAAKILREAGFLPPPARQEAAQAATAAAFPEDLHTTKIIEAFRQYQTGELTEDAFNERLQELRAQMQNPVGRLFDTAT